MKIYTKKGDKGETRMLFGDAVSKDDLAPDAYGSVDELVAALGLILSLIHISEPTRR